MSHRLILPILGRIPAANCRPDLIDIHDAWRYFPSPDGTLRVVSFEGMIAADFGSPLGPGWVFDFSLSNLKDTDGNVDFNQINYIRGIGHFILSRHDLLGEFALAERQTGRPEVVIDHVFTPPRYAGNSVGRLDFFLRRHPAPAN